METAEDKLLKRCNDGFWTDAPEVDTADALRAAMVLDKMQNNRFCGQVWDRALRGEPTCYRFEP